MKDKLKKIFLTLGILLLILIVISAISTIIALTFILLNPIYWIIVGIVLVVAFYIVWRFLD